MKTKKKTIMMVSMMNAENNSNSNKKSCNNKESQTANTNGGVQSDEENQISDGANTNDWITLREMGEKIVVSSRRRWR